MAIKDDYTANTSTKGELVIPTYSSASLVGNIETKGDHDWFKVYLVAGKAYHFGAYSITEKKFLSHYEIHNSAGIKLSLSKDGQENTFIASKSDDYYIDISGNIGKYKVFATEYYDDYANNVSTTGVFENKNIIGNSDYIGDLDWFKINMTAGRTYYFESEYHTPSIDFPFYINQSIKLYNSSGKLVDFKTVPSNYGTADNLIGIFTPSKSNSYFLEVNYSAYYQKNYNIGINSFIDDFSNTIAQANLITTPTLNNPVTIKGRNQAFFDNDFFAINLKAGLTYKIEDSSENKKTVHLLELYDINGKIIQSNANKNGSILFKANETNKLYINVAEGGDTFKHSPPNFSVTVTEVTSSQLNSPLNNIATNGNDTSHWLTDKSNNSVTTPTDDYSNNLSTTGNLLMPDIGAVSIIGNIEKNGDHDWIKVHLLAGETYSFHTQSIRYDFYPVFILSDATGNALSSSPKKSEKFFINKSGDYYLDLFSDEIRNDNNKIGTYEVTASKNIHSDDYEDNILTTGRIVNDLAIGNAEYSGDTDWFKMELQAGQTYFFERGYSMTSHYSEFLTLIKLYDDNGKSLPLDKKYDYYELDSYTPNKSGSYYFSVSLFFSGEYNRNYTHYKYGIYKLTDDFSNDIKSAHDSGAVELNHPLVIKGKTEAIFDKDFFSINLKAGFTYKFENINRPNLPYNLELYNSSGKVIASSIHEKYYIIFTALKTDKYYLNVENKTGDYRQIIPDKPDYSITITELQQSVRLNGTSHNDVMRGGNNNDTLNGSLGDDKLVGNFGNDKLNGGLGNDKLYGDNGHDTLNGGNGQDIMYGGSGFDKYVVDNTSDNVIEVSARGDIDRVTSTVNFTLPNYVEELILHGKAATLGIGNNQDNLITTNGSINVILIGKAGNDKLNSAGGNDVLDGGIGDDRLVGGAGNDLINGDEGADTLVGGNGNDVLNGGTGNDYIKSGDGLDLLDGGTGNDVLEGGDGNDHLKGGTGNDRLEGGAGNNILEGGEGNDILDSYYGESIMKGGSGNDVYNIHSIHDVIIESALDKGIDTVESEINYTLPANVENLKLLSDNTRGYGNNLNNKLEANQGSWFFGYAGNDHLISHGGSNLLVGGLGKDNYLTSGDTIRIHQGDSLVNNFDVVEELHEKDRLDLDSNKIAANTSSVNGNDVSILHSHHISQGIISFDDLDTYAAPLKITENQVTDVIKYLQANITQQGDTVAFIAENDTYVFQDGGAVDTLVKLVGVIAEGIHNKAAAGSIHLI